MAVLSTVAGTLMHPFHPHGRGTVSQGLIRGIWCVMHRLAWCSLLCGTSSTSRGNHALLSLAGLIAFTAVIAVWGGMVVVGFALILWPHFPEGFTTAEGVGGGGDLADAL